MKWDVDTSSFIPVYSQCQWRKPISTPRLFPLYVPFHNKHFNVFQAAGWFGIYHFRVPSYILILKRWEIAYIVYAENLNDSEIWELNPELKTAFAKFKVLEFMLIFFIPNKFLTWKAKQQAAANGERQGRGTRCEIFFKQFLQILVAQYCFWRKQSSTCLLLISRFSDFAFSDRGSQTPLPFVKEAEVLPASNCHDYKSCHN